MLKRIFILFLISLVSACATDEHNDTPPKQALTGTPLQAANAVVQSLNRMQTSSSISTFTNYIDPTGVRFSPYYYVEPSHLSLTGQQIKNDWTMQNPPKKVWGVQDGKGDPISLTVRDYFARYIWNFPYHNKSTVTLINSKNDFLSSGNTLNNMLTVYPMPQYRIVEYHQAGINPIYAGMDWSSLMVVLKDLGNHQWSLVGLVHGAWTI